MLPQLQSCQKPLTELPLLPIFKKTEEGNVTIDGSLQQVRPSSALLFSKSTFIPKTSSFSVNGAPFSFLQP
jgi:hypothetical protein